MHLIKPRHSLMLNLHLITAGIYTISLKQRLMMMKIYGYILELEIHKNLEINLIKLKIVSMVLRTKIFLTLTTLVLQVLLENVLEHLDALVVITI